VYSVVPDHSLGITSRASLTTGSGEAHGASSAPSIDNDGEVAFASVASDLGPTVSGGHSNVYLRNAHGQTLLISRTSDGAGGNGDSDQPVIAAGGRLVVFHSTASDLVGSDVGGHGDVFLYNRDPMDDGFDGPDYTLTLISTGSSGQGDGDSDQPALAVSGGSPYIAFRSAATNLVGGDTNGMTDVFLRHGGATTRASLNADGGQITTGNSAHPAIAVTSAAVFIAFESVGPGVTALDTSQSNVYANIRLLGASSGQTVLVSTGANGASSAPSISDDGNRIAFQSDATNLNYYDGNNSSDVFVRDLSAKTTELVSWSRLNQYQNFTSNAASTAPAISGNGRFVAFVSRSTDLGATDSNGLLDVYEYEQGAPIVTRLSQSTADDQATAASGAPALATGGLYAAFASDAPNLVGSDSNGVTDVFRRQRDVDPPSAVTGVPDARHVLDGNTWSSDTDIGVKGDANETGAVQSGVAGYYWRVLLPGDDVVPLYPVTAVDFDQTAFTEGSSPTITKELSVLDPFGLHPDNYAQITGRVRFQVQALDRTGNYGPTAIVGPYLIDKLRPGITGKVSPQGVLTKRRKVTLTWQATDVGSGVGTYDVYYQRKSTFLFASNPAKHYLLQGTTNTKLVTPKLRGGIYTWYVVAHDRAGNTTTKEIGGSFLPTSVRALRFSSDWTRVRDKRFLGGEAVTATRRNASVKIKTTKSHTVYLGNGVGVANESLTAFTLVVVATTCPACGRLGLLIHFPSYVTAGTTEGGLPTAVDAPATLVRALRSKDISLHSAKIHHRKLFTFRIVTTTPIGNLGNAFAVAPDFTQIFVTTSGHPVTIEALAEAASLG
ncbi:MAG: hypothetical protein QOE35_2462, partial [Actinomycetota bacterium]